MVVLALATGFSGGCNGPGEAGRNDAPVSADGTERAMDEYIKAAREGDFEGAWRSHEHLLEEMRRADGRSSPIERYCTSSDECPPIGYIGWILGKSKSDLAYMDDLDCREHVSAFSCKRWNDWVRSNKIYLGETRSQAPPPPQEVELSFIHSETHGDMRPWTVVKVAGQSVWAMLNSGGYSLKVSTDAKILVPDDAETFEKPVRRKSPLGIEHTRHNLVLQDFVLGSVIEESVPAVATDYVSQDVVVVGTTALLRYSRICFSWSTQRLYLGSLGPCANGAISIPGAALRGGVLPTIPVPSASGTPIQVLVDTGAPLSLCQDEFVERMGGRRFRFGPGAGFEAICSADSEYALQPNSPGDRSWEIPALIGMDTLIKFDAFGWELNPFRMYFLPKALVKP